MQNFNSVSSRSAGYDVDTGLRNYFLGIYKHMTGALLITGAVSWWAAANVLPFLHGPIHWIVALLPLLFVIFLGNAISNLSMTTVYAVFYLFAACMGVSLCSIFATFTSASIARAFFISAGTFAAFSIYGYTTRRDLTSIGGFLFMGLIGVVIAGLVNLFFASTLVSFVISCITVLVFVGFTAYDTQQLKEEYLTNGNIYGFSSQDRSSIHGALQLYLDFINIFVSIVNLTGIKRD